MVEYGARRYADEVDVQHDLQSRSNDEVNGKDCTQPNRVNARPRRECHTSHSHMVSRKISQRTRHEENSDDVKACIQYCNMSVYAQQQALLIAKIVDDSPQQLLQ